MIYTYISLTFSHLYTQNQNLIKQEIFFAIFQNHIFSTYHSKTKINYGIYFMEKKKIQVSPKQWFSFQFS